MKKCKFLHVLWHDEIDKFNPKIIRMISEEPDYFNRQDHKFITPFPCVYDALKQYGDIKLVSLNGMVNRYGKDCEWIILHAITHIPRYSREILGIKRNICNKIVLRTWGHDIRRYEYFKKQKIKNAVKRIVETLYFRKIRQFYAIGVANDVDILNIEEVLKVQKKTFKMSYGYKNSDDYNYMQRIKEEREEKEYTKILIGHSAYTFEEHIEMFEYLEKFKEENIRIMVPLIYPRDLPYIESVKKRGTALFGDKIEYIEEFVPYNQWAKMLSTVDIALLNTKASSSLGTLSLLLNFGVKVYVNPDGVIAGSFRRNGIIPNYIPNIPMEKFENFIQHNFDIKYQNYVGLSLQSEKKVVETWKTIFDQLTEIAAKRNE